MPGFFNRVSILLYAEEMPCLQAMGSLVVNLPGMLLLILSNIKKVLPNCLDLPSPQDGL
jgi:hypothetical protein